MNNNFYTAWKHANDSLREINEILAALNKTLPELEIPTIHKLVIQGFLMQVLESIDVYQHRVKPIIEELYKQ